MLYEWMLNNTWFIYISIALFSLCVGSLLNLVIYRLPIMLEAEWKEQCCELFKMPNKDNQRINLFLPRSFCPQCKSLIKAWQNIPVISYLILRGRCYTCKKPISMRYPFVELLTLALSLYATWSFGLTVQLAFILLAIWIIITIFFIDLDHQLLPDNLSLSLLWLGLIANSQNLFIPLSNAVLSAAGAYLSLWIFIKLFYLITGKVGMGHGDFKLFAAFGAWFGWMCLPLILLLSTIIGSVVGLIYLKYNEKTIDTTIPFGPFLCLAGLISMFWGPQIIHWYVHLWV